MVLKNFLSNATSPAFNYINTIVKPNNKQEYQKLKKVFEAKFFEARSFDDTSLDLTVFDWQGVSRDRNWWWQLQALPFLNWFVNSYKCQSDFENKKYYSMCLKSIECWAKNAKNNKDSPLVWHDHATAFRLRNLTNWLLFCHVAGIPIGDDPQAQFLVKLILEHLDWLQVEKNYSRLTNHGFDQALIALTVGLMFVREGFESYCILNRQRLRAELSFAFTDEGVHKENSPGYQKMMLGRLKQLRALALLGEREISELGESYIGKAEAFLRAITLPNGYLPLIGDTRDKDEGLAYIQNNKVDLLDYSKSGYVIFRGKDGLDKEFLIILKNSHESNYHRHDDDMMIYFFYDGCVVLGDGGLYNYNEKDEKRVFLRSHKAHSVPYLDEMKAVRDRSKLKFLPSIEVNGVRSIRMKSFMFDEELVRDVEFDFNCGVKIGVFDSKGGGLDDLVYSNFLIDSERDIRPSEEGVIIDFSSFLCAIKSEGQDVSIYNGWNDEVGEHAIASADYGVFKSASRLVFRGKGSCKSIVQALSI